MKFGEEEVETRGGRGWWWLEGVWFAWSYLVLIVCCLSQTGQLSCPRAKVSFPRPLCQCPHLDLVTHLSSCASYTSSGVYWSDSCFLVILLFWCNRWCNCASSFRRWRCLTSVWRSLPRRELCLCRRTSWWVIFYQTILILNVTQLTETLRRQ